MLLLECNPFQHSSNETFSELFSTKYFHKVLLNASLLFGRRYLESEIESQVAELREELKKEGYQSTPYGGDTHQLAEASQRKDQELRAAFGIRDDYVGGSAFDTELQAAKAALIKAERQKELE